MLYDNWGLSLWDLFHLSYYPPGESYLGKFKSFPVQFHFRKSH